MIDGGTNKTIIGTKELFEIVCVVDLNILALHVRGLNAGLIVRRPPDQYSSLAIKPPKRLSHR